MEIPEAVAQVLRVLAGAGHEAVLAGGCVRDWLLGREAKDFDIATSALPDQVAALFPRSQMVGAHFGVVIVPAQGRWIEVATFRSDGAYQDGRRPESVSFTNAEGDARRRDFTINGLFYDPNRGEVIDFVDGRADLQRRKVRAIGEPEARFAEDHLRLLRAVRFATVLEFEIEKGTWQAVRSQAALIQRVSAERVRDELDRLWLSPQRLRGFDLLHESGLMAQVLPELLVLQGCEQPPEFHPEGDVFVHTRLMLSHLPPNAPLPLVLAVLLHDIAKPATQTFDAQVGRIRFNGHDKLGAQIAEQILRRLKYSNQVIDAVVEAVAVHMQFMHVQDMRQAKLRRFMARPGFANELELHRVDCLGSNGRLDNHQFLLAKEAEFASEPLIPPRLVDGRDLIALGWPPGPQIGKVLRTLQNLQLEGDLKTREDALAWLAAKTSPPPEGAEPE